MKHLLNIAIFVGLSLCIGCSARFEKSTPIPYSEQESKIAILNALPKSLPEQSSPVPDSQYVMIQSRGGSIFLGVFSLINIQSNTNAMAKKYQGQLLGIDPYQIAKESSTSYSFIQDSAKYYTLNPFVFVQHCYDDKFRLSLVFQVQNKEWVGRYTYHLPTNYDENGLKKPSDQMLTQYKQELASGSRKLYSLIEQDLNGQLGSSGNKVDFGSLYLMGSNPPFGKAEDAKFFNTDLVEEGDDYIIVRQDGNLHGTVMAMGLIYGVHYFAKDQLHFFSHSKQAAENG